MVNITTWEGTPQNALESLLTEADWYAYNSWVNENYSGMERYKALLSGSRNQWTYQRAKENKDFQRWLDSGKPQSTSTQRSTGSQPEQPQASTGIDPAYLQWLIDEYGTVVADAVVSGKTQYTNDYMFNYWKTSVVPMTGTTTTGGTSTTGFGGIPEFPTTAPPRGYHWELQEGLEGWNWIPLPGTLNSNEQTILASQQLEQAKFEWQKSFDERQLAQSEAQMAQNKEMADREFQLALEQLYANLAQSPENWIVATEFLNKIKPGEAQPLTVPKFLSPLINRPAGTALEKVDYTVPSARTYNRLSPTEKQMLSGYSKWLGGPGLGDIAQKVEESLPQQNQAAARWKPAFQV